MDAVPFSLFLLDLFLHWPLMVLTAGQITETFRHGSLLEDFRARYEGEETARGELVRCGFCFSHHPAWFIILLFLFSYLGYPLLPVVIAVRTPIYWLATVRASQILHDLVRPFSRVQSAKKLETWEQNAVAVIPPSSTVVESANDDGREIEEVRRSSDGGDADKFQSNS